MEDVSVQFKGEVVRIRRQLGRADIEGLARRAGVLVRRWRKVSPEQLLLALLAGALSGALTCQSIATAVRLLTGAAYSRQSVHKRLSSPMCRFLSVLLGSVFSREVDTAVFAGAVGRVLVHDSTSVSLPQRYADIYRGSGNQCRQQISTLKFQVICDLLTDRVCDLSISGFVRNDQSAAADVLAVAHKGDLVLRDLGYFVLSTFRSMDNAGIFYLSRWRYGVAVFDAASAQRVDLAQLLKRQGRLDMRCLLGADQRLPARIIALPVSEAVAAERRRKAKNNRNQACNPNADSLFLKGYTIFVTNLPEDSFSAEKIEQIYALRWRIETIFKAWKSHIGLNDLQTGTLQMLQISVMTKLIYCALTNATCQMLDTRTAGSGRQASLLRVARIIKDCGWLIAAMILQVSPHRLLSHILFSHAFYEKRKDRKNMKQKIYQTLLG